MPTFPVRSIARYAQGGAIHYGRIEDGELIRLSAAPWSGGVETGERDRFDQVRLLAPSVPTKVVCVGLNYGAHIAESQSMVPGAAARSEPMLFLKPPSAVIGIGEAIRYPAGVTRLDPEGELAVVIGRRARAVPREHALEYVAGFTCFNDVSARNYQKSDGQWARAKGFDTFAPLGPWIVPGLDPGSLALECRVNGAVRQRATTRDLLFTVDTLIAHISAIMTL